MTMPCDPLAALIAAARADLDAQEPEVALLRALALASDAERPRDRAGLLARLMRRQYVAGRLAGLETAQRMVCEGRDDERARTDTGGVGGEAPRA